MDAAVLRLLFTPAGDELEWGDLLATYSPWSLDAHVRLPDGSRLVCLTRLVPLFEAGGEVSAMVEVYRGHPERDRHTAKHFVYSLDAVDEGSSGDDPALRVQQELGRIALAFDDLERVVRPYERLLPALQAEDPLTEAIAGIAAETRDMAAVADMPRLLDELSRALERLRTQVARLTR